MIYFAKIHNGKDGYWTEFPEFNSSGSEGATIEAAKRNSKEALEGLLESLFDRDCNIPQPRIRQGKKWLAISVDDAISIPIVIRQMRLAHRFTLKQMAKRLNITYQSYQALETLRKSNPTIKTLRRVAEVFEVPVWELLKEIA